jgi:hypothetical protein
MSNLTEFKLDKSAFSVVPLSQADDDLEFWLSKTPKERLEALEFVRQVFYGYDPATTRLQRVFEFVKREEG